MLKLVPMQAVNWLERREIPSRSSDFKVIGIVAAVLDVLIVLAMTSSDPSRNRHGAIFATTAIWSKYHITWIARPSTTTRINQSKESRNLSPSFLPTIDATIPKTARAHSATTHRSTFISSSKPI